LTSRKNLIEIIYRCSQRDLQYVPGNPWKPNDAKNSLHDRDDEDCEGSDWEDDEENDVIDDIEPNRKVDAREQEFLDLQFQRTIEEYDEDEIGDLGEVTF